MTNWLRFWVENLTTKNDHTARITLCGESHLRILDWFDSLEKLTEKHCTLPAARKPIQLKSSSFSRKAVSQQRILFIPKRFSFTGKFLKQKIRKTGKEKSHGCSFARSYIWNLEEAFPHCWLFVWLSLSVTSGFHVRIWNREKRVLLRGSIPYTKKKNKKTENS